MRVRPGGSRMAETLALCAMLGGLYHWAGCGGGDDRRCALAGQSVVAELVHRYPHRLHLCSSTSGAPSLSPTAIRSALSSRLRPRAALGTALSHALELWAREACRRARAVSSMACSINLLADTEQIASSYRCWTLVSYTPGLTTPFRDLHAASDLLTAGSGSEVISLWRRMKGVQWHQQRKPRRQKVPADAHYGLVFPPPRREGRPGPRRMSTDWCWELAAMFLLISSYPSSSVLVTALGQCAGCRGAWGWRRCSGAGRALCVPGVGPAGRSLTTDRGASPPAPCLRPCLLGWGCLGEWRPPGGIP